MNRHTTHQTWHPLDTDDYLQGAIDRVNAARKLPPFLTYRNTGFLAEWWHQKPGDRPRYYTRAHIAAVGKRMKKVPAVPDNVTSIEDARATRTTGGKKSWSMKGAGR